MRCMMKCGSLPMVRCAKIAVFVASIAIWGCHGQSKGRNPSNGDNTLAIRHGSGLPVEAFAQLDSEGRRHYRLLASPGRVRTLIPQENAFPSIQDLVQCIRAIKDAPVYAIDFASPSSPWIIGEDRVDRLRDEEIARIKSLLTNEPNPKGDSLIRAGVGFPLGTFAQSDSKGRRYYRLVAIPSGRKGPLPQVNSFMSVRDLPEAIRKWKDAEVFAADFTAPSSPWIVREEKVERLTDDETAEIRRLLGEEPIRNSD